MNALLQLFVLAGLIGLDILSVNRPRLGGTLSIALFGLLTVVAARHGDVGGMCFCATYGTLLGVLAWASRHTLCTARAAAPKE